MPTISVIVPVYNVEKHLCRCIDSILAQTFSDFELILVDDGSPDRCPQICDAYAKRDDRIRVIHKENGGQSAARNLAVSHSKGEWICFVDSDDLIHPQMLDILYNAAIKHGVNISMCSAVESAVVPEKFFDERCPVFRTYKINEAAFEDLFSNEYYQLWVVWGKLIRREIVEAIPMENGRIYEDNAVACQWLDMAGKVTDTRDPLYFYMVNPTGTTKSNFKLKNLDFLWSEEVRIHFFEKLGYTRVLARCHRSYILSCAEYYSKVKRELGNHKAAREIRNKLRRTWWYHRNDIVFSNEKKEYIMGCLWPKTTRLYSYLSAAINIVRSAGLLGLLDKIKRKQ